MRETSSHREPVRVLYVDGDPGFLKQVMAYLADEHGRLTIETVTSADAGMDRLADDIDCIVSGYDVAGMDGVAFLEAVREEYVDLPFFLYADSESEGVASEAISAGVTDYFTEEGGTAQYAVLANRIDNAASRYVAERRANERERELERQNEQLKRFASLVSHDIRTPLTVAKGRLELMDDACDSPHIEDASHALDRISVLLEKLLTLARTGQSVTETRRADLDSVARDAWKNVETSGLELVVNRNCELEADPERLRQLFENLFENSIEHAGSDATVTVGSIELVPVTTRATGSTVKGFYVADDGPGIPEDEREDVLEWGFTTTTEGTGFGLAIVSQIAKAHGWDVAVTEGEGGGTRFEITGEGFHQLDAV
ncbi:hybrid sensor histidine kinase/response regulator [Natronomonas sp. LN261]|jgi:two-component system OmpR family sensor kinase|uniref:ATP-binding response regulator n=1 Tax=Natronomonas sp. LN261 TaxID=2750669 RepID=UPI0015EFA47B|nr:HAMP domain-containing sensor histidine kinase [Natronomonas sp. LN261]